MYTIGPEPLVPYPDMGASPQGADTRRAHVNLLGIGIGIGIVRSPQIEMVNRPYRPLPTCTRRRGADRG